MIARRTALKGALATAALALGPAAAARAAGTTSYIRAAHLVPGFPGVTMTAELTAFDGSTRSLELAGEATYGAVTDYRALPAGTYAVAVRPAGTPATTAPVLTTTLQATAGSAWTIAGLGEASSPRLAAIQDDVTPAPAGTARVRVLPAAEPGQTTRVAVAGGTVIAEAAVFSQPSAYVDVPAGRVQLQASTGTRTATTTATMASGSVYTLLVLADGTSGLSLRAVTDTSGTGVVPVGGADTGGGGLARAGTATATTASEVGALAGGAVVAAGVAGLVVLRRRRPSGAHRA